MSQINGNGANVNGPNVGMLSRQRERQYSTVINRVNGTNRHHYQRGNVNGKSNGEYGRSNAINVTTGTTIPSSASSRERNVTANHTNQQLGTTTNQQQRNNNNNGNHQRHQRNSSTNGTNEQSTQRNGNQRNNQQSTTADGNIRPTTGPTSRHNRSTTTTTAPCNSNGVNVTNGVGIQREQITINQRNGHRSAPTTVTPYYRHG